MRIRVVVLAATLAAATSVSPARTELRPTAREGATHAVPLYGELIRQWDAPEDDPFAAGHRGIDIAAPVGTPVRSSAQGVVSFAGVVAGNRTVSVDHPDGVRTSYSFLETSAVTKDDVVDEGTVLGTSGIGHRNAGLPPHVHLSARRDGLYFDPIKLYVGTSYADLLALTA